MDTPPQHMDPPMICIDVLAHGGSHKQAERGCEPRGLSYTNYFLAIHYCKMCTIEIYNVMVP